MRFRTRLKVEEEIPTSSMGDIAFLLIVFFMVTTVFAARKGMMFTLPKVDDQPTEQVESDIKAVYIRIQNDDSLLVDRRPMTMADFRSYANMKLEENPQKFFIIHPLDRARFGTVMDVLDELRMMDVKNVTLPTKEEIKSWGNQEFLQ